VIHIIDYGMGNVGSIANMIRKVGGESLVTGNPEEIHRASKIIIPGVGAFDHGIKALEDHGLVNAIKEAAIVRQIPMMGICLGMQLMLESSEEGVLPGLGLISGRVRRFDTESGSLRVPHMGWNTLTLQKPSPLFEENAPEYRFYFVHSYYVTCAVDTDVLATTFYGKAFHSAFQRGNLIGVQFHPEKSHRFGMELFRRFLEM
jgi:glutamine amidotransferase